MTAKNTCNYQLKDCVLLYIEYRKTIPANCIRKVRNKDVYAYLKLSSSKRVGGKLKHNMVSIGKIVVEEDIEMLIPNDNFFKYVECSKVSPKAITVGSGRKRKIQKASAYFNLKDGSVRIVGYSIAYLQVANESGLFSDLESVFGTELTYKILAVGAFMALGCPGGLSNIDGFTEENLLFTDEIISSQRLSDLYHEIAAEERDEFFNLWIKRHKSSRIACYDVTSISSFSALLSLVSFGYNRDKEKLPQLNLGMFCDIENGRPLMLEEYDGAINDFTNLPYVLSHAKAIGIDGYITLVLDGGFATSSKTLDFIQKHKFNYIVGAPIKSFSLVKEKLLNWRETSSLYDDSNFFNDDNDVYYYKETSLDINGLSACLTMYKSTSKTLSDQLRVANEINALSNELEQLYKSHKAITKSELNRFEEFFDIQLDNKHTINYYQKDNLKIKKALLLCGCFALLSTGNTYQPKQTLELYRSKDVVEKAFDSLKNDILQERLHVSTAQSAVGKLFIAFIALVLLHEFRLKWKKTDKLKKQQPLKAALYKLLGVKCRKEGDRWKLTEAPTATQQRIIEALDLPIERLQEIKPK